MIYCNLAGLMANKKVNISEVSRKTHISRTTLTSLYYNDFKGIQTDTANTLCKYFNVGMDKLFLFSKYDFKIDIDVKDTVWPHQIKTILSMITLDIDNGTSQLSYDFYANCYFYNWDPADDETEYNMAWCDVSFEFYIDTDDEELAKKNKSLKNFFNSLSDEIRACVINNLETKVKEEFEFGGTWKVEYTFHSEIW